MGEKEKSENETKDSSTSSLKLTDEQVTKLGAWMTVTFPNRLLEVKPTNRLADFPAVITDHESSSVLKMMRALEHSSGLPASGQTKQRLEINPSHPIIIQLNALVESDPNVAEMVGEQVVDMAFVAAGLMEDGRIMLPRMNKLLVALLEKEASTTSKSENSVEDKEVSEESETNKN